MSGKPYPTAPPMPQGYPQQQQAFYPQQYPQPQYPTSYPYQQPYVQQGAPTSSAPPPYSSEPSGPPPPYSPYPTQSAPPQQSFYPQQQPQAYMAHGVFDAGARFDGVSQPRLPPPPPGVAPNAAQMAMMQGHTVVGTQQKSNWFSGSSDNGGSTWGGF